MNIREFKEKFQISDNTFGDTEIQEMINTGSQTITFYLPRIKDCVILYEASRRIGDKVNTEYYKNKLLGMLGMVY